MKKKTSKQLDVEVAQILICPTNPLPAGTRVTCSYRAGHVGKVLSPYDPRAWANTAAFPTDKPDRESVMVHVLAHPTTAQKQVPVLYPFGVRWDSCDSLVKA